MGTTTPIWDATVSIVALNDTVNSLNDSVSDSSGTSTDGTAAAALNTTPRTPSTSVPWTKIVLGVVLYLVVVVTVLGNCLVLIAVARERRLRTVFNYYIVNLAVTDIAVAVTAMSFYTIENVLGYWPFGQFMCGVWIFFDYGMTFSSVFTLIVISVDRFWSVSWSLSYRIHHNKKKAYISIAAVWVVMLILWLPPCITDRMKNSVPKVCKWEPSQNKEFVIVVASLGHHGSCLVLLFCYIQVFLFMRRRMKVGPIHAKKFTHSEQTSKASSFSADQTQEVHEKDTETSGPIDDDINNPDTRTQGLEKEKCETREAKSNASCQIEAHADNMENENVAQNQNQTCTNNPENAKQEIDTAGNSTSAQSHHDAGVPESNVPTQTENHTNDPDTSASSVKDHGSRNYLSVPVHKSKTNTVAADVKGHEDTSEVTERRERKVFVTLTYIIFGYMICWVPFHFVFDLSAVEPSLVPEIVYTVTFWMTYLNSTVNPFLYNFSSPEFRKAFKKILHMN